MPSPHNSLSRSQRIYILNVCPQQQRYVALCNICNIKRVFQPIYFSRETSYGMASKCHQISVQIPLEQRPDYRLAANKTNIVAMSFPAL